MRIRNRSKASQLGDDTRCEMYVSYVLNYGCFLGRGIPNLELGSASSFINFSDDSTPTPLSRKNTKPG